MSLLARVLEAMWVDPEILEQLNKDQKEILYHKIREEQVRRWRVEMETVNTQLAGKQAKPAIRFATHATMFAEIDEEAKAREADQRLQEAEKARARAQMEEDERQAKCVACLSHGARRLLPGNPCPYP